MCEGPLPGPFGLTLPYRGRSRQQSNKTRAEFFWRVWLDQYSVIPNQLSHAADVACDHGTSAKHSFDHREGHRLRAAWKAEDLGIPIGRAAVIGAPELDVSGQVKLLDEAQAFALIQGVTDYP